jgi:hypothetical protein
MLCSGFEVVNCYRYTEKRNIGKDDFPKFKKIGKSQRHPPPLEKQGKSGT